MKIDAVTIVCRVIYSYKTPHKKSPCSPKGTRTESTFSAVPPCLQETCRSARCQHTGCPLTLAMRQKILRENPVPTALSGPFAAPLFAPLSATGTLCGCALQLYSRFYGFKICYACYTLCVCVCQELFCAADGQLNIPGQLL